MAPPVWRSSLPPSDMQYHDLLISYLEAGTWTDRRFTELLGYLHQLSYFPCSSLRCCSRKRLLYVILADLKNLSFRWLSECCSQTSSILKVVSIIFWGCSFFTCRQVWMRQNHDCHFEHCRRSSSSKAMKAWCWKLWKCLMKAFIHQRDVCKQEGSQFWKHVWCFPC